MHLKTTFKSIGAVLAGFITVFFLSVVTDMIVEGLGIFPPQNEPEAYAQWMLAFALFYRSVYTILGGYVAAKLSVQKPMRQVFILAVLGTIGGVAGVFVGWEYGNHWYPIALAVTAFPFVWLGGRFSQKTQ